MDIHFTPQSMLDSYSLTVAGGSIIIDGASHSLAALAALGEDDQRPPFVVSATQTSVTLLLPYWGRASDSVLFPQPLIDVPDGPVELPR